MLLAAFTAAFGPSRTVVPVLVSSDNSEFTWVANEFLDRRIDVPLSQSRCAMGAARTQSRVL